ncbi:ParB/RepB/Spo0J family partition protein [Stenotrophomonas maltophilia]
MSNNNNKQKNGPKPAPTALAGSLARLGKVSDMMKRKDPVPSPTPSGEAAAPTSFRLDQVHRDPKQPRGEFNEEKLQELAESIRQHGVIQPIVVREHPTLPGQWMVVTGERRWRASKLAGKVEIPAVVTELTDQEIVAVQLIENLQREDLSPIEVAEGYRKLQQEFNLTQEAVAETVGKSKQTVSDFLKVLEMPAEFQQLLSEKLVRGAADLNALWRANGKQPDRVAALIAGATQDSPITRVMIRSVTSTDAGDTPSDGAGSPAGRTPPSDHSASNPGPNTATTTPTKETGSSSNGEGSTPGVVPKGKPGAGGSGTVASANELVYTISTAQKNGDWIATVRLGVDRLFGTEPTATAAEAIANAATWLRDNAEAPA